MRDYELEKGYFEWLYDLVCNDGYVKELNYQELLFRLHQKDFVYILPRDENRFQDGVAMRYYYGYEVNAPREQITDVLDNRPCSVLEMLIALSIRMEQEIMSDTDYGNRTWKWFWKMMTNMNLGGMTNDKFDGRYVDRVIERMLARKYEANGRGGLFTIANCKEDLRNVEIWTQMNWYLNSASEV